MKMSDYRVNKLKEGHSETVEFRKFDSKEDAEHYAKNQSVADNDHLYQVQKNHQGEFSTIKTYRNGQVQI